MVTKRAHSSGKSGPAFDQQRADAEADLDALRRQEWGRWKAACERKYPPSTPEGFAWAINRKKEK